jgi:hypothetical protein
VSSELNDFLDWIEVELTPARREAARHIDRAEALAVLRSRALPVAQRLRRPLTVDDVFASSRDERERAELRALADRVTGGGEPADEISGVGGTQPGSSAAF